MSGGYFIEMNESAMDEEETETVTRQYTTEPTSDVITSEWLVPPLDIQTSESSNMRTNTDANDDEKPVRLVDSHFFDDFELTPTPEKHFNLTPRIGDADAVPNNDMVISKDDKDIDTSQILAADHPLLDRFQRSLKEQLTKRIYLLRQDVAELEEGSKIRNSEKETVGMEAYETQQTANKQQDSIESCLNELETVTAAREELEYQLLRINEDYFCEKDMLMCTEKDEIQVRNELESIDVLLSQMKKWEEEIESELMINQRILDNTEKCKMRLFDKKKEQDTIIYNLMNEVWKLESELETMVMQLRVREADRERLAESVALANIDIEANQTEYRCLLHGWQSVLVTITQRDKHFNGLQFEFRKFDDKLSSVNCELIHIRKEIQREHLENERLTLLKDRLDYEYKNTSRNVTREYEKRDQCLKLASQYNKLIEENSIQRNKLKAEIEEMKEQEILLSREVEVNNQMKYQLEQDIVTHLQANAFNSDACRQMANVLKDIKEENRRMRINIAKVEGQISGKHAEWQTRRLENNELTLLLRELKQTVTDEDADLYGIGKEFVNCEKELSKLIAHYEVLKQKTAGDAAQKMEMWPQEVKIRQLEATIADLLERNKQSQSFWLREQAIVVDLSEKRQAQMKEMDLLKKQIRIMDQKNLRINDTLEDLETKEDTLNRSINALENKLYLCTSGLNRKQESKSSIDVANNKIQSDLVNKLEESEFESLKLKAEIVEIEEDKLMLSKELIEKNREALGWEKKLMMIIDTRRQMHDSQSESGDISQMKCEIHRMNEYEMLNKKIDTKEWEAERSCEEIDISRDEIFELTKSADRLKWEVEKARIDRQLNLDILLFKQRKLKIYTELARGRSPFLNYKTPSSAHNAYVKERELNSKLRRVVEETLNDVPPHTNFLTKLHNACLNQATPSSSKS